jgi:predicted nucleic-acid-binding protein
VKITVDTNVLIRAIVQDDVKQGKVAGRILKEAAHIAIPLVVLCEFVWVLKRVYDFSKSDIAAAINSLITTPNIEMNRLAVAAGLDVFLAGGDFADGVIAYDGRWLGGETFVSFDKEAVSILKAQGQSTRLL